jgi:hypothetical protein
MWLQFLPDRAPLLTSGGQKKEEQRMICLRANELQGRLSQTVKGLMPVIHTRTFYKIYGARSRFIAALNLLALVN